MIRDQRPPHAAAPYVVILGGVHVPFAAGGICREPTAEQLAACAATPVRRERFPVEEEPRRRSRERPLPPENAPSVTAPAPADPPDEAKE